MSCNRDKFIIEVSGESAYEGLRNFLIETMIPENWDAMLNELRKCGGVRIHIFDEKDIFINKKILDLSEDEVEEIISFVEDDLDEWLGNLDEDEYNKYLKSKDERTKRKIQFLLSKSSV